LHTERDEVTRKKTSSQKSIVSLKKNQCGNISVLCQSKKRATRLVTRSKNNKFSLLNRLFSKEMIIK